MTTADSDSDSSSASSSSATVSDNEGKNSAAKKRKVAVAKKKTVVSKKNKQQQKQQETTTPAKQEASEETVESRLNASLREKIKAENNDEKDTTQDEGNKEEQIVTKKKGTKKKTGTKKKKAVEEGSESENVTNTTTKKKTAGTGKKKGATGKKKKGGAKKAAAAAAATAAAAAVTATVVTSKDQKTDEKEKIEGDPVKEEVLANETTKNEPEPNKASEQPETKNVPVEEVSSKDLKEAEAMNKDTSDVAPQAEVATRSTDGVAKDNDDIQTHEAVGSVAPAAAEEEKIPKAVATTTASEVTEDKIEATPPTTVVKENVADGAEGIAPLSAETLPIVNEYPKPYEQDDIELANRNAAAATRSTPLSIGNDKTEEQKLEFTEESHGDTHDIEKETAKLDQIDDQAENFAPKAFPLPTTMSERVEKVASDHPGVNRLSAQSASINPGQSTPIEDTDTTSVGAERVADTISEAAQEFAEESEETEQEKEVVIGDTQETATPTPNDAEYDIEAQTPDAEKEKSQGDDMSKKYALFGSLVCCAIIFAGLIGLCLGYLIQSFESSSYTGQTVIVDNRGNISSQWMCPGTENDSDDCPYYSIDDKEPSTPCKLWCKHSDRLAGAFVHPAVSAKAQERRITDGSCQSKAREWMSTKDTAFVQQLPEVSAARLRQRYVVASLACEWNIVPDLNNLNASVHECAWLKSHFYYACRNLTTDYKLMTQLDANGKPLAGPIPPELGILTQLNSILLKQVQLTGSIPTDLVQLTLLREIDFSHNSLTGTIPSYLFEPANLTVLNLAYNLFNGTLSPSSSQKNHTTGRDLFLNHNALTGSIPATLATRPWERLRLNSNQFTGMIPPLLSSVTTTRLREVILDHNKLRGPIPVDNYISAVALETLTLDNNDSANLTGNLNPLCFLRQQYKLQTLVVDPAATAVDCSCCDDPSLKR